jgi:hypothetical protein
MTENNVYNFLKLAIIIIIIVLLFRLFYSTKTYEGFQNNIIDRIFGNLYNVTDISYNSSKTECTLIFQEKIRLDSLILKLGREENNEIIMEPVTILYKDDENNYEENYIYNNEEINHMIDSKDLVVLKNPLNKFALPIVTNAIKIKLLGETSFTLLKHWIYGMTPNSINRTYFANSKGEDMVPPNISSSTDLKQPNHEIYKYSFDNNIKCYAISFRIEFTTDIINENNSRINMSVPIEIHYKGLDEGSYKIESVFNTNDFVSKTMIYLPAPIVTNTIYIKVPKQHNIGGTNIYIKGISDEKMIATKQDSESFQNSKNSKHNRNNRKENFQGSFDSGYSADDMCPSLEAMEEKLKLTDQICARLEYNDKIKNERIKLERNKQYILKLKQQDEEIKKLENIVKSLQDKRENRDVYNDALRLSQLEKQKRQAAVIQDLAQDRVNHRKSNVVNIDVNLKNKPLF